MIHWHTFALIQTIELIKLKNGQYEASCRIVPVKAVGLIKNKDIPQIVKWRFKNPEEDVNYKILKDRISTTCSLGGVFLSLPNSNPSYIFMVSYAFPEGFSTEMEKKPVIEKPIPPKKMEKKRKSNENILQEVGNSLSESVKPWTVEVLL